MVLPFFYANICSIAIFTPFVEEFAKAYPLFYRHGETPKSLFILGFFVGLGFGLAEFVLYVFVLNQSFIVRLPGILFHAASTSITAYGIAKKTPIRYYLISVVLHFVINVSSIFSSLGILVIPISLTMTYLLSWKIYYQINQKKPDN